MSDQVGDVWRFSYNTTDTVAAGGSSAPPLLVPAEYSASGSIGNATTPAPNPLKLRSLGSVPTGLVDIINQYYWTHTPLEKREEVPVLFLSEKRLLTNALVAQAFYSAATIGAGTGDGILARAISIGQNVGQNLVGSFLNTETVQRLQSSLGEGLQNFFSQLGGTIGKYQNNATNFIQNAGSSNILNSTQKVLDVYQGLYITEATGWNYKIPYFQDRHTALDNSFSESNEFIGQGALSLGAADMVGGLRDVAEGAAGAINIMEPGTYIERPKFYQFPSDGERFSVKFPLLNTGHATYADVIRNWQVVFLLIYQNRPSRFTRDLIEPPVIYELELPGQKYMPFAYITNLEVQFLGSRRIMQIPYKDLNGINTITTIIPDGYLIDITFQGLVGDSRNFDYASLNTSIDITVQENGIPRIPGLNPYFNTRPGLLPGNTGGTVVKPDPSSNNIAIRPATTGSTPINNTTKGGRLNTQR